MVQRGRKSPLTLLETAVTDDCPRPEPPAELTAEEASEWVALCNVVPANYFNRAAQTTLTQYCRHVAVARHLAQLIHRCRQSKKFDVQYRQLIREQRGETQAIYACLRSMRLTHLSIRSGRPAVAASPVPRPWET